MLAGILNLSAVAGHNIHISVTIDISQCGMVIHQPVSLLKVVVMVIVFLLNR